jgi:thioredoxin 1
MKRIDVYTSERCRPCKLLKPILEDLKEEHKFEVNYIDLETKRVVFDEYDVTSTPTMIFFENGTEYNRYSGFAPRSKLEELL